MGGSSHFGPNCLTGAHSDCVLRPTAMASKEVVHAFKWHRAFAKLKAPVKEIDPLSRYTNFTLGHVWEKFDCQTSLLTKEALLPLAKRNPALFDPDLDNMNTVRLSLASPKSSLVSSE